MPTHYQGSKRERQAFNVYIKLVRASESVTARINHHLADANLTISQFGVLEAIYHLGPLCQNELGKKILKSSGNMTMVIDNLCKRGLVERTRNKADRRYIIVSLTEAGDALISEIFPKHVKIVQREIGVLSPEEQTVMETLCRKLGLGIPE